ncbi:hypothetical protein [Catellatospora sp. TT07R-123]|uniref:hypothetical protein n=1 Tax=Catellatospora sp. TT07R-123 TaxID=2733863 RepID=UPI001BB33178|nr:hypothetical protein [Catellatospora sp. TT07R-123]
MTSVSPPRAEPLTPFAIEPAVDPDGTVHAVLSPQADLPLYAGHYPGFAILPGAFLLDAADRMIRAAGAGTGELAEVANCRFRAPVRPGTPVAVTLRPDPEATRWRAELSDEHGLVATFVLGYTGRP